MKNALASIPMLGVCVLAAWAQSPPTAPAPPVVPSTATPPPPPAAPASAGAIVIKYKVGILDKDRDGFVSREEASGDPELSRVFDKLDRNRDGKLEESELAEYSK